MSNIRKYIDLVESAQSVTEDDGTKGKLTFQQYQAAVRHFEVNYDELDQGKSRTRFGTHHYNPQERNLQLVAEYLNTLEPGHFYRRSEVNKDEDAKKCFNNVYNVDRKPVADVVYDRFSMQPVGVYMHSFTSDDEARERKAEQDLERKNDQQRKMNKGEY